ncbi:MBL fold metallo-hydrolase RNA specificity domain-containing protein [Tissierella praeacuta]|uniref:MBL fold metallo-hydrolase RNA specificity domain-containing protein n=1 Tax=Tissierella praeacuta TaxID=43131 RepID=UPI003DA3CD97
MGIFDHVGLIPLLIKQGFKGKIIATAPTAEFCKLSFLDSAKIMESDCELANKRRPKNKLKPLYTKEDAKIAVDYIQCYDYNTEIVLDEHTTLELKCAGHILGACMPKFTYQDGYKKKSILFTGDISGKSGIEHPFLKPTEDLGEINYLVMESTYGDRIRKRVDPIQILTKSIQETCIDRKKTLVLPVFSLQRSSEILWLLREAYIENQHFFKIPIYLDTPMGIKAQGVMDTNREYWGKNWDEIDKSLGNLFKWDVIEYIEDYKDSQALANGYPKIILSSSGMCSGGRIISHIESFLPSKGCKFLFSGYQVEGTLGWRILNTEHKTISVNRRPLTIRAEIEQFSFSSHADLNGLVEIAKTSKKGKLKQVFINHGSEEAMINLKSELEKHLENVKVTIPEYKEEFNLK